MLEVFTGSNIGDQGVDVRMNEKKQHLAGMLKFNGSPSIWVAIALVAGLIAYTGVDASASYFISRSGDGVSGERLLDERPGFQTSNNVADDALYSAYLPVCTDRDVDLGVTSTKASPGLSSMCRTATSLGPPVLVPTGTESTYGAWRYEFLGEVSDTEQSFLAFAENYRQQQINAYKSGDPGLLPLCADIDNRTGESVSLTAATTLFPLTDSKLCAALPDRLVLGP